MKISVEKVRQLEQSGIVALYENVIIAANASGDVLRIKAAKRVEESRLKLVDFFKAVTRCKVKRNKYVVPTSDFQVVDGVSLFLKHDTIFTKTIKYFGSNKSR